MRKRQDVMKERADRIAAGLPVEPLPETPPVQVEPPVTAASEPDADPPKRRSRSMVHAPKDPAADAALYAEEAQSLARAVEEDAKRQAQSTPRAPTDATTETLTMGTGYDRIVTHLFSLEDPMKVYEEVRESLRMGRASSASYGQLVNALDEAEESAMRSMDLLINAKDAHDAFEIDAKIIASGLRDHATVILEDKKAKKEITKSITNDDVEAVMAANYPDEWQDLERKRGRAKRTIDLLAALHEAARERAKDLRAMVSKFRGDT